MSSLATKKRRGIASLIALFMSAVSGLLFGIGGYALVYAKGASYLEIDSGNCENCHVMQDHLAVWTKAGHQYVSTCNDGHDVNVCKETLKKSDHHGCGFLLSVNTLCPAGYRVSKGKLRAREERGQKSSEEMPVISIDRVDTMMVTHNSNAYDAFVVTPMQAKSVAETLPASATKAIPHSPTGI